MNQKSTQLLEHQPILQKLLELHAQSRLPHGLLLVGPEGVGKKLVALHLAQKILQAENLPHEHPDLIKIIPEKNRIKIDTIRELKKDLNFTPLKAPARVILIEAAHCMNQAAANALLKSLEEPPSQTYFILITYALGWIPKTIVSRTQKIRFPPLSIPSVQSILQQNQAHLSKNKINWSQGSAHQALQLALIEDKIPDLRTLLPSRQALSFDQIHQLAQNIDQEGLTQSFLQGLLSSVHQILTGPRKNHKYDFDLLNFAEKIIQLRNQLRLNLNAKLNLTRLLLYFQEPKETRL